jgi:hypothetical protein
MPLHIILQIPCSTAQHSTAQQSTAEHMCDRVMNAGSIIIS